MRIPLPIILLLLLTTTSVSSVAQAVATDWKNFTYPWYPSGYKPSQGTRKITLHNGEFIVDRRGNTEDLWFSIANVSQADLTGDGKDEAIITVTANTNPNGSVACVFVYSLRGKRPHLLWKHETGDRAFGGLRAIQIANRNLIIEQYQTDEDACMPCAKRFVRSSYHWNGQSFLRTNMQ